MSDQNMLNELRKINAELVKQTKLLTAIRDNVGAVHGAIMETADER